MRIKWAISMGIGAILTISGFVTWYMKEDQKITVIGSGSGSNAWVIPYESADQLINEKQVDLIVRATVTPQSEVRSIRDAQMGVEQQRTFTEVHVNQILKSDSRLDSGKSTLTIVEPTYLVDNGIRPGKTEYTTDDYRKAEPNEEYIFFLTWSATLDAYQIYGLQQGKYNVDGKDGREKEMELQNADYHKLKQQVLEKYGGAMGL